MYISHHPISLFLAVFLCFISHWTDCISLWNLDSVPDKNHRFLHHCSQIFIWSPSLTPPFPEISLTYRWNYTVSCTLERVKKDSSRYIPLCLSMRIGYHLLEVVDGSGICQSLGIKEVPHQTWLPLISLGSSEHSEDTSLEKKTFLPLPLWFLQFKFFPSYNSFKA